MTDVSGGAAPGDDRHLIYFADPMCSWCYGFVPTITAVADYFDERLPIDLVMGGLRAGNTEPMGDKDKAYLRSAWTRVHEASGQPFNFDFLDRDADWVYDTEPACRAVVTMRGLAPRIALRFKESISQAFYAENRDVTQGEVLADIAEDAGIARDVFLEAFGSDAARATTLRDFMTAQKIGVEGFPTLIVGSRSSGQYALVTNGFRPLEGLIDALEQWLATTPAGAAPRQPANDA